MDLQQNIERLEAELTLMKGEIKQTLVDLREFIVQRRAALGRATPDGGTGISQADLEKMLAEARSEGRERGMEEAEALARQEAEELEEEELEEEEPEEKPPVRVVAAAPEPKVRVRPVAPPEPPPVLAPSLEATAETEEEEEESEVEEEDLDVAEDETPPPAPAPPARREAVAPRLMMSGQVREPAALDANLVANLIRWVEGVKRKLGGHQLTGLIEIYKLTGHLPPSMERIILQMATIGAPADTEPEREVSHDALTESLLQLQGIVYGPGYAPARELMDWDRPEHARGPHG